MLVSAGGGGVGVAAIQIAKIAGARVITTVGSQEKAQRTRTLGADAAVNYREQDFVAEVQKFTDGKGVDVIIENVAADNFAKDFAALAVRGRIVLIGTFQPQTFLDSTLIMCSKNRQAVASLADLKRISIPFCCVWSAR